MGSENFSARLIKALGFLQTHALQNLGLKAALAGVTLEKAQPAQCQSTQVAALMNTDPLEDVALAGQVL